MHLEWETLSQTKKRPLECEAIPKLRNSESILNLESPNINPKEWRARRWLLCLESRR